MLNCTVQSGTPVVEYQWTRDGSAAIISTEVILNVIVPGSYTCLATNAFGQDTATSIITGGLIIVLFPIHVGQSH